jgi:hypothetical protein
VQNQLYTAVIFLPPCETNSLDNMLNLKQFLHDTYTLDMEDESFDYDLADIERVLSELPGQAKEEDEIDDIPREMLAFGNPDGLEEKVTDTQGKTLGEHKKYPYM